VGEGVWPAVARWLGREVRVEELTGLGEVRHAITRYRLTQTAYLLPWAGRARGWVWREPGALEGLAFSAAHRRLARRVEGMLGKEGVA